MALITKTFRDAIRLIVTESPVSEVSSDCAPKVLFYIPQLDGGGPDRVFYELISQANEHEYHPVLLTNRKNGRFWKQLQDSGIEIHSLDVDHRFPIRRFADFVRSFDAQLVLCTLDSIMTASFAKQLYRLNVNVIARPANHVTRSSYELFRKRPLKYSLAWLTSVVSLHLAKMIVCQSQDIRDDLRKYMIPERSMTVIGNPVTLKNIDRKVVDNRDVLRFVSLGRLSSQKGYDILIDGIGMLPPSVRGRIRVEVYGDGPDFDALQKRIRDRNVNDVVSLCGFVDDVHAVLRTADFFISSSRYEGFPNAVLEELEAGVSVIASDCPGGTREIVIPTKTGWLFKSESPADLCRSIQEAIEFGPYDSNAIREFVAQTCSTSVIVSKYATVFKQMAT